MQTKFDPHPDLVARWDERDHPPVSEAALTAVEAELGVPLPPAYREFLATYGTPGFSDSYSVFDMTFEEGGQTLTGDNEIAFMFGVDRLVSGHKIMTTAVPGEDDVPKYPPHFLGIANNTGQDTVLLDLRTGAVKFWYFDEWPWGKEGNTRIWDVADSYYDFVNGLRLED